MSGGFSPSKLHDVYVSGDLAGVGGWVHLEELQLMLQDPAQDAPFSGKPALALGSESVAFLIA